MQIGALTALLLLVAGLASAQPSVLLDAMASELDRNFKVLKGKPDTPAYYLSYQITEQDYSVVSASLGALTANYQGRSRTLEVSVRVDNAPAALRSRIWLDTEGSALKSIADTDRLDDFARAEPSMVVRDLRPQPVDKSRLDGAHRPAFSRDGARVLNGFQFLPGGLQPGTRVRLPEHTVFLRTRQDCEGMPPMAAMEREIAATAAHAAALADARHPVAEPGRPGNFPYSQLEGRQGARVLPEYRGRRLFGSYPVDREGVAPTPVSIVEKGVLRAFLLTRRPVRGYSTSNGRARLPGSFGHNTAAPGNLFVHTAETVSPAELKKRLIAICQTRREPYGVLVRKMDFPTSAAADEVRGLHAGSSSILIDDLELARLEDEHPKLPVVPPPS
ncbi:MAG TPA: metallopeptidase TldD-related protein [Bryobacteraceae bacterium]|nr:metallopeptidase TldD-related protein [Bryobacteraceae bacterium]